MNGKEIGRGDVVKLLKSNEKTDKMITSASINKAWCYIAGTQAMFLVAGIIHSVVLDRKEYGNKTTLSTLTLIEVGLAIVSGIVSIGSLTASNSKFQSAIKTYNKTVKNPITGSNNILNVDFELNRLVLGYLF